MARITLWTLPLYLVPLGLLIASAVILYRRRWTRRYPAFFLCLCLICARGCTFLPLAAWISLTRSNSAYTVYFYSYWYLEAIESVLVLIVFYRIFERSFSRYPILHRWTFLIYGLAICACLVLAVLVTPAYLRARGTTAIVLPLWQSTIFMRAAAVAFVLLFIFGIGIRLHDYLFGIAAGFALNACIILISTFTTPRLLSREYENAFANFVSSVVWFAYLFVPQTEQSVSGDLSARRHELTHWRQILVEFLRRRRYSP